MLSIGRIGAGDGYKYLLGQVAKQDASAKGERLLSYYERTGYPPGAWWGKGTESLQVSGKVTEVHMQRLFGDGHHPITDAQLGRPFAVYRGVEERMSERLGALGHQPSEGERAAIEYEEAAKGTPQAVAGFDLTFSAPKSVSILWGLASEAVRDQVTAAHEAAWKKAMTDLEADVAATRLGRAGVAQVDIKGLTAATFMHFYSRAGDPQLHTHVAVSNFVETTDGRWRRLDSKALYAAAAAYTERYDAYLREELEDHVGVRWWWKEGRGVRNAEIVGIDPSDIALFSSRTAACDAEAAQAIAAYRERYGHSPDRAAAARLRKEAVLRGRPDPEQRVFTDQRAEWQESFAAHRGIAAAEVEAVLERATISHSAPRPAAGDKELGSLVPEVLARILESQGTWSTRDMERHGGAVLSEAGYRSDLAEVRRLVEAVVGDGHVMTVEAPELVEVPDMLRRQDGRSVFERAGEERWTHGSVLRAEDALVRAVDEPGRVLHPRSLGPHLECLGEDQRGAVVRAATSGRLLDAVIGPAGSGKTTATAALAGAWREGGHQVHALAPSAVAAEVLADAVGLPGLTIDKALFLWREGEQLPSAGDLVLVDEASMASTLKLAEVVQVARNQGSTVRLVGDPAQLSAVGPSGVLGLVARAVDAPELHELHRFSCSWEGPATLRLRRGDASVLGLYEGHGRIRGGLDLDVADQVYTAWQHERAAGRDAIMVASTNATAQALSERARLDRVAAGQVEPGGVALQNGSVAGVGDEVVTRSNRSDLKVEGGRRGRYVKNNDRWVVATRGEDGSLCLRELAGGGVVTLPCSYVADHVELAYAHTAHRGQGVTADVSLAIVGPRDEREHLYVAMTRGRQDNVAFVVTDALEEEDHGYRSDHSARVVLERVLANHTPASATEAIELSQAKAERLDTLADRYEHARDEDLGSRMRAVAEEVGAGHLVGDKDWGKVLTAARYLESAGTDAADVLACGPTGSAAELAGHIREFTDGPPPLFPNLAVDLVLAAGTGTTEEVRNYLDSLTEVMSDRVKALRDEIAGAGPPAWAASLGRPPDDPEARAKWVDKAVAVAAWRERSGFAGSTVLGEVDPSDLARMRAGDAAQEARAVASGRRQEGGDPHEDRLSASWERRPRPGTRMNL